jgi:ABC-type Fe3+ transport system permease subunit
LLGSGVVALIVAFTFSIRAMRQGRSVAMAPLLLSAFVMFFGLVAILGAFGRFYGWDG